MKILIKGAGDLASGIAFRLKSVGHEVVMTDLEIPTAVRREVAFSRCIYEGRASIEGVTSVRVKVSAEEIRDALNNGYIPVVADPDCTVKEIFKPDVIIDSILAKTNLGTKITDAGLVIGVGPGFTAGVDCHAVIETKRGHTLGRVIKSGTAIPNTGVPGNIGGFTTERLIRASAGGLFIPVSRIGDEVDEGDLVGRVLPMSREEYEAILPRALELKETIPLEHSFQTLLPEKRETVPVYALLHGIVRGMLQEGVFVKNGLKSGDIDPRAKYEYCFQISDKALSIAGGALEAVTEYEKSFTGGAKKDNIAVVLLAAGLGARFGSNKLLEAVNGKPLVCYSLENSEFCGMEQKYLVTGSKEIAGFARELGYTVIINERPEEGISRSLILGLKNALLRNPELDGVMFSVCDQPLLSPATVKRLKEAFSTSEKNIACIDYDGEMGNPNIIGKKYFTELFCLEGDTGGKRVILRHREDVELVRCGNEKELNDIDRKEDLKFLGITY